MKHCPECQHEIADSTLGKFKCPNCYSLLEIIGSQIREIKPLEQPRVTPNVRKMSQVTMRTKVGTVDTSIPHCRVCINPLRHDEDSINHPKLGTICKECFSRLPRKMVCRECLTNFSIQAGHLEQCPMCESGNVVEKILRTPDMKQPHTLPSFEVYARKRRTEYGDDRDKISDGSYLHGSKMNGRGTRIVTSDPRKSERKDNSIEKIVHRSDVVVTRRKIVEVEPPKLGFKKG